MTAETPAVPCPVCSTPLLPADLSPGAAPVCPKCPLGEAEFAPADAVELLEPIPAPEPLPLPPKPKHRPEDHFATGPLPPRRVQNGSVVGDFLRFRVMLLPVMIQVVFWVGTLLIVGQGLLIVAASFDPARKPFGLIWSGPEPTRVSGANAPPPPQHVREDWFSPPLLALGLAVIVLGPTFLRMGCECFIVVFQIHDELKAANDRHQYRL